MTTFQVSLAFQSLNFELSGFLRLVYLCISQSARPLQTSVKYLGAKGTHSAQSSSVRCCPEKSQGSGRDFYGWEPCPTSQRAPFLANSTDFTTIPSVFINSHFVSYLTRHPSLFMLCVVVIQFTHLLYQ